MMTLSPPIISRPRVTEEPSLQLTGEIASHICNEYHTVATILNVNDLFLKVESRVLMMKPRGKKFYDDYFELDTSTLGTYQFIPVAIDGAGNIQFIAKNDDFFTVEVVSKSTTTKTTTTTSTSTTSPLILDNFIILSFIALAIFWRKKYQNLKKGR